MKYHLFVYTSYYPSGGVNDYVGSYKTIKAAKAKYHPMKGDYMHGHITNNEFKKVKVFNECGKCIHYYGKCLGENLQECNKFKEDHE